MRSTNETKMRKRGVQKKFNCANFVPLFPAVGNSPRPFLWPSAQPVLQPQPPDQPKRFVGDSTGHLRLAVRAIRKSDWHLDHFESLPPKLVRDLDLKAVAVGMNFVEIDGLKRA